LETLDNNRQNAPQLLRYAYTSAMTIGAERFLATLV